MKGIVLCLALIAGCAGPPPAEPLAEPPLPSRSQAAPAERAVVRTFDAATRRETAVVLDPSATSEQIERIRAADRHARLRLTALGKQRHAIKSDSLAQARSAVDALDAELRQH